MSKVKIRVNMSSSYSMVGEVEVKPRYSVKELMQEFIKNEDSFTQEGSNTVGIDRIEILEDDSVPIPPWELDKSVVIDLLRM